MIFTPTNGSVGFEVIFIRIKMVLFGLEMTLILNKNGIDVLRNDFNTYKNVQLKLEMIFFSNHTTGSKIIF